MYFEMWEKMFEHLGENEYIIYEEKVAHKVHTPRNNSCWKICMEQFYFNKILNLVLQKYRKTVRKGPGKGRTALKVPVFCTNIQIPAL